MSWSMEAVSYRMSGSGNWQSLLPDEAARKLYAGIYPDGLPALQANEKLHYYLDPWQRAHIIRLDDQQVFPTGPIMTNGDLRILQDWFNDISGGMAQAVLDKLPEYEQAATELASPKSGRGYVDNILTILICALTLDSQVFFRLRKELMGTYPGRDFAGTFFFWGYGFSGGPLRIFGFTTYGRWRGLRIHVIRSRNLDREKIKTILRRADTFEFIQQLILEKTNSHLPISGENLYPSENHDIINDLKLAGIAEGHDPPRLCIPVLSDQAMIAAAWLIQEVSEEITENFLSRIKKIDGLISQCSFRRCTRADIYCLLFHLAYSYAADKLVEKGAIPGFPSSAGGEWGVWVN